MLRALAPSLGGSQDLMASDSCQAALSTQWLCLGVFVLVLLPL